LDACDVVAVETALYRIPLARPVIGGATRPGGISVPLASWDLIVCTVRTASGVTGTGFTYALRVGGAATHICLRDDLAPLVLGVNCWATEELWDRLYWATYYAGRRGLLIHALSALDIALWDCKARTAGVPLAQLLGAERREVQAYDSNSGWLSLSVDELARNAAEAVHAGFKAFKVIVGSPDPRDDVRRVAAVRRALGDGPLLMTDAGQKWNLRTALEAIRGFAQHDVHWLEEPVSADDVEAHRRLFEQNDLRIATGQCLTTRHEIAPLLAPRAIDVLQHDVARIGGITEWWRVAHMGQSAGVELAPHFFAELHVSLVTATPAGRWVEHTPWLGELLIDPPVPVDGRYSVPEAPGHGLVLRPDLEHLRIA
jgi:L-alanine-DL-glutamate epimerase-like enolase superfamily enzyme